jgi:cytochrome c-type biogenesis protein CcmH
MILFWLLICALLSLALLFVVRPLFSNNRYALLGSASASVQPERGKVYISLFFVVLIPLTTLSLYFHWGHSDLLREYYQQKSQERRTQEFLTHYKTPEALIRKLQTVLKDHPDSAKGWYLLGRLYMNNNQMDQAVSALQKANQLKPESTEIQMHLLTGLFYQNHEKLNEQASVLFKSLQEKNLYTEVLLNFKGLDAFHRQHYSEAIQAWETLLKLIPPNSATAKAVLSAIAVAQKHQSFK